MSWIHRTKNNYDKTQILTKIKKILTPHEEYLDSKKKTYIFKKSAASFTYQPRNFIKFHQKNAAIKKKGYPLQTKLHRLEHKRNLEISNSESDMEGGANEEF